MKPCSSIRALFSTRRLEKLNQLGDQVRVDQAQRGPIEMMPNVPLRPGHKPLPDAEYHPSRPLDDGVTWAWPTLGKPAGAEHLGLKEHAAVIG